jgi:2-polyprenyl-3-methyl-5-hydroxy-6-metoxy-1,4-benzoquinol methylase
MQFKFKEVDQEGLDVLDVISSADKFNYWMYSIICRYCKGDTLEIGCGVGNISQFFVRENKSIFLSDIRSNYREIVKAKFNLTNKKVLDIDIVHEDFNNKYFELFEKFDSVICLNVIEHVKDDQKAIENMFKLLKKEGNLVVLVPAYNKLYNSIDIALEHFRRYNKKSIVNLMFTYGQVLNAFYFNSIGILGWFVSGTLFKNKTIPEGEMKLYNKLVPIFKVVDKLLFNKVGLSVICVIKNT